MTMNDLPVPNREATVQVVSYNTSDNGGEFTFEEFDPAQFVFTQRQRIFGYFHGGRWIFVIGSEYLGFWTMKRAVILSETGIGFKNPDINVILSGGIIESWSTLQRKGSCIDTWMIPVIDLFGLDKLFLVGDNKHVWFHQARSTNRDTRPPIYYLAAFYADRLNQWTVLASTLPDMSKEDILSAAISDSPVEGLQLEQGAEPVVETAVSDAHGIEGRILRLAGISF